MSSRPLGRDRLGAVARELARREPVFSRVLAAHGPPPLWSRPPVFATLALIILEQQVSLASARAAFERLRAALGTVTAARLAAAEPASLHAAGITRAKTRYLIEAGREVAAGRLRLAALARLDDEQVHERLAALTGIGRWSTDVWLLMVLRRPDVWPVGDRALVVSAARLWRLPEVPDAAVMQAIGERFRPWRSVAARLLWHWYLREGRRT